MGDEKEKPKLALGVSLEISGAKEMAQTADKLATAGIAGATATLTSLCKPGADETGSLIRDVVNGWRERNFIRSMAKTQKLLDSLPNGDRLRAHPRLLYLAVQESSLTEDETLQDMWAALLAGSCSEEPVDDGALICMNILKGLTAGQARLLLFAGENSQLVKMGDRAVVFGRIFDIIEVALKTNFRDPRDLLMAVSHMKDTGLLNAKSGHDGGKLYLTPTPLTLGFLDQCQKFDRSEPRQIVDTVPIAGPGEPQWVQASMYITDV